MKKILIGGINNRINFKAMFGLPIDYYSYIGAISKRSAHSIIVKEHIGKTNF